jgi:anthranilate phosphoribosyltransferase
MLMDIQESIRRVAGGGNLSLEEAKEVFGTIMGGNATPAQIAALLVGLRMKGETVEEITGAASAMRDKVTRVVAADSRHIVDTCGTGGDSSGTFNISTAAAFVAAGAGATVAKHGNRSVSSKCGSADVLEALGVAITVGPEVMKRCLDEAGICFLFAPTLHTAMKHAIGPRKEIGIRTIFNILGPLTNPAFAPSQVLGVFSPSLTEVMARVLGNTGSRKAYVVHGSDGLDEVSLSAPTRVSELSGGKVVTYDVHPGQFGLSPAPPAAVSGGGIPENAALVREVLDGKPGPRRDIVALNAAFAIAAAGLAATPAEGLSLAQRSIDSGAARSKLDHLQRLTSGR